MKSSTTNEKKYKKNPLGVFKETLEKHEKDLAMVAINDAGKIEDQWTYKKIDLITTMLAKNIYKEMKENKENKIVAVSLNGNASRYAIALLAVWKAGCVYMPIMPDKEVAKVDQKTGEDKVVASRMDQAGAKFLLNDDKFKNWIKKDIDLKLSEREKEIKLGDPAYINCSSGSTGDPKIILSSFEGLSYRVYGMIEKLKIKAKEGLLGYPSPDFDANILDILMALYSGACLFPVTDKMRKDPAGIRAVFKKAAADLKYPITSAVLLPKTLEAINIKGKENKFYYKPYHTLRSFVTMGEKCSKEILQPWFQSFKDKEKEIDIWNGYGPTETTIATTMTKIGPDDIEYAMEGLLPGVKLYLLPDWKIKLCDEKPRESQKYVIYLTKKYEYYFRNPVKGVKVKSGKIGNVSKIEEWFSGDSKEEIITDRDQVNQLTTTSSSS